MAETILWLGPLAAKANIYFFGFYLVMFGRVFVEKVPFDKEWPGVAVLLIGAMMMLAALIF